MPTTPSHWTDASVIKYCLSGYFLAQRTTLVLIQPLGILFLILSFVYVWPCWGFVVAWAFLQPQRVGATLQLRSKGFLLQWSSCCGAWALGQGGFRSCGGTGALGHRLGSCRTGLAALRHVQSSRARDRTCVSCTGRRILYHWATKEALNVLLISIYRVHFFILFLFIYWHVIIFEWVSCKQQIVVYEFFFPSQ